MSWVKVVGAANGRKVFVNGNLVQPAGFVGTAFEVEIGLDTFQILTTQRTVELTVNALITDHPNQQDPQRVDMSQGGVAATGAPSGGSAP